MRDTAAMEQMQELATLVGRHLPATGMTATAVPRLSLFRADQPTAPMPAVYDASFCLITQGSKLVSLGEEDVLYDASRHLLVSVDLPLIGHVVEASAEMPYLCCKIDLDHAVLADLMATQGQVPRPDIPVLAAYPNAHELVDAVCRLVKLLDQPSAVPVLGPLIEREILYRLITGPHGPMLRHIASAESRLNKVSRAIARIRGSYHEQLRIGDIAAAAGMSPSSLHDHFKAVTRMTPLEYQKQLRLQEARRLMLSKGVSAGSAGFAVGYESPSQFSREYARLFGAPPRRDIERLQMTRDQIAMV